MIWLMATTKALTYGGIDLGGTKVQAVITDDAYSVLASARRPTPTSGGPEDVVAALDEVLREAAKAAGVDPASLAGVGVGAPGKIEEGGAVTGAHHLPGWGGTFPLASALSGALGCPVRVDNDVTVATDAEFQLGAGQLYDSLLGVFWGTGVGGGLIIDGKPWSGMGAAGEIGHVVVEMKDGAKCPCGRYGCMEAYAGRQAMEDHVRRLVKKGRKTILFDLMEKYERTRLTSGIWARALKRNDKLAIQTVDRAIGALGVAIASTINVLDVEGVVIGGGLGVKLGHPYAKRIAEAMRPHLVADWRPPHVHVAALGDLSGAIGGALLAAR